MTELTGFSRIADLYDTYVQVDFDVPFFLAEAQRSSGEVLELMSGTGRVSIPLAEAGVRLTCVDKSGEMLAILRDKLTRRGLSANVVQMDVCELDLGKTFDLIIIPFHSFSEIVSLDDERRALVHIREHLSTGGRFICTLRNPAVGGAPDGQLRLFSKHPLSSSAGTLLFWMCANLDAHDPHVVHFLEFFEEYDAAGKLKDKRVLDLDARRIFKSEFQDLAASAGFRTLALYGDYNFAEFREDTSPFMLWECAAITRGPLRID